MVGSNWYARRRGADEWKRARAPVAGLRGEAEAEVDAEREATGEDEGATAKTRRVACRTRRPSMVRCRREEVLLVGEVGGRGGEQGW